MPTLVRLLTILAVLAGIVFAIMAALVYFVVPVPHPVSVEIPVTIPPAAEPEPAPALPQSPFAPAPSGVDGASPPPATEALRP